MTLETILFIVSGVLTVAASLFGVKYAKVKKLAKEAVDVVIAVVNAWEDDKVTAEETDLIVKEAKEAAAAFKDLLGKE